MLSVPLTPLIWSVKPLISSAKPVIAEAARQRVPAKMVTDQTGYASPARHVSSSDEKRVMMKRLPPATAGPAAPARSPRWGDVRRTDRAGDWPTTRFVAAAGGS